MGLRDGDTRAGTQRLAGGSGKGGIAPKAVVVAVPRMGSNAVE